MSLAASSARQRTARRDAIIYSTGDRVIRVRRDNTTVTFEEKDDSPRAYQNRLPEGTLPGFGEEYDECGDPMPHFCSDCGHVLIDEHGDPVQIGQTCWRRDCPRCAPGWAMKASYTITSKIEDYRKERAYQRGGHSPKFHHIALIPPHEEGEGSTFRTNTDDPLDTAYDIAKIILSDELGADGGALIYHPYSGENGDDRGAWKERLFKQRDFEGDVRDELIARGHFHAICVADHIDHQTCKTIYEKTGWVVHRIEDKNNVSLYGVRELASATTYALSHAYIGDGDTYRYFGAVANHKASDQTEARMRRVVRQVAPETLGIQPSKTHCQRPVDEEDPEEKHQHAGTGSGDGDGTGDSGGDDLDSTPSTPSCGGRLVPLHKAPGYLENQRLRYAEELRHIYMEWDGAPPPD